jgi:hypothetical protein
MMSKKTAIIFILVVFIGALGALIWFYFSSNAITNTKTPTSNTNKDVYDPFGTRNPVEPATTTEPVITESTTTTALAPDKLRQISIDPISGFSIIDNTKTKRTDVHYILRANGNIYETYTDASETKRLSITTVPKVYDSQWFPDGVRLIINYLKDGSEDIQTFSVKINPATTTLNEFEGGIDGVHLPEKISALTVSPLGDKIFYLVNNLNGVSGFTAKSNDLEKKVIFESPIKEWLVSWPKADTITLNTKASASAPGYLYFLNSQTGNFLRVIGGVNGLTSKTNNTATQVLFSDGDRGKPRLFLYDVKSGNSKLLPWSTFPEKCVWSNTDIKIIYCAVPKDIPTGDYPDLWYQGLVSFTDDIWMINTDTMASTLVFNPKDETNNDFDLMNLQLDKNTDFLFFIDKKTLTFWSLNLN